MKGHVTIHSADDGGFHVYEWTEEFDSAQGFFCDTRKSAVALARRIAHANNRRLECADVVPLIGGVV